MCSFIDLNLSDLSSFSPPLGHSFLFHSKNKRKTKQFLDVRNPNFWFSDLKFQLIKKILLRETQMIENGRNCQSAGLAFISAFVFARFGMGGFFRFLIRSVNRLATLYWKIFKKFYFSITGPTLPVLASNLNVSLAKANWIYAVR